MSTAQPFDAVYLHVPFCAQRCGYCNFTLVAGRDDLQESYLDALSRELTRLETSRYVSTIFIGGGTPTHFPPKLFARFLALVRHWLPHIPGQEFSVEANPQDLSQEKVELLALHRVTRLSLGAQSFHASTLQVLERQHRAEDIHRALELARPNLSSISLDLIFAVPGQSLAEWKCDLAEACALPIDHLSTYGLTFEKGTQFWNRLSHAHWNETPEELQSEMYLHALDSLCEQGFEHYEVSNFARPGHRCRHNEVYWRGASYEAFGPGAARYVDHERAINHRSTTTYLKRVLSGESPIAERETLSPRERAREAAVFGLRRLAGWERTEYFARTGFSLVELLGKPLLRFLDAGLLQDDGQTIRLTRAGLLVSDSLWPYFLRP